jgi:NAD(P)-dependent dehydrogenase (short-subunit alcohol dehydrogenase family)
MRGRAIAITGAFGALGRVVAETAAQRGALVAAIGLAAPPIGLTERFGANALILLGVDLGSAATASRAMGEIKSRFGRLDALINIAGGFEMQNVEGGDSAIWERLFATNLTTALNASRAALPYLLENGSGRIVNVGALGALKAGAGMGAYAASKSAVHRLTESMAEELKHRGVTVNAVLPSIIDTPANRADMPGAAFNAWVAPADLAAVILFLASDEASAVTGALLPVTGGM